MSEHRTKRAALPLWVKIQGPIVIVFVGLVVAMASGLLGGHGRQSNPGEDARSPAHMHRAH